MSTTPVPEHQKTADPVAEVLTSVPVTGLRFTSPEVFLTRHSAKRLAAALRDNGFIPEPVGTEYGIRLQERIQGAAGEGWHPAKTAVYPDKETRDRNLAAVRRRPGSFRNPTPIQRRTLAWADEIPEESQP